MTMAMLLFALAMQGPHVTVHVRQPHAGLRAKVFVTRTNQPVTPQVTGINGQTRFPRTVCSAKTEFWAQSEEPTYLNPSGRHQGCTPKIILEIEP